MTISSLVLYYLFSRLSTGLKCIEAMPPDIKLYSGRENFLLSQELISRLLTLNHNIFYVFYTFFVQFFTDLQVILRLASMGYTFYQRWTLLKLSAIWYLMDTSQYVFPNPIFPGKNIGKEMDCAHTFSLLDLEVDIGGLHLN